MKLYLFAVIFSVLFCATTANADGLNGQVTGYAINYTNGIEQFFFKLDSSVSAGCNQNGMFAIDSTRPSFKTEKASLMMAFITQTFVHVVYPPTCTVYNAAWDVGYLCFGQINC